MKKTFYNDENFNTDDIMHALSCDQYKHLIVISTYKGKDRAKFGQLTGTAIAASKINRDNIGQLTAGGVEFFLTDEVPKLLMRFENVFNESRRGVILSRLESLEEEKEMLKLKLKLIQRRYPEVLTFI
jgi:hypothetical protein